MSFDPMNFNQNDPRTWPSFRPLFIAHDVGRSNDRSTAVVGGNCTVGRNLLGIAEFEELPQGLYGTALASELAVVDRRHHSDALIVADVSNNAAYAEVLYETFGRRVIGLQITRHGDGINGEWWPVKSGAIPVYTIGRSYLIELFYNAMQTDQVRFADGPKGRRAFEQLTALETEMRETGIVYKCPPGQHDDLGISCAMLAWAARHPHLDYWLGTVARSRKIRKPKPAPFGWGAFT
jgi:hypothetical protein